MLKEITKTEANLILDFAVNKLTQDKFIDQYPEKITQDYVNECLESALEKRDSLAVGCAMTLAFRFDLFNQKMLPVLEVLLVAGWHKSNEDIAHVLQKLKSPTSIEPLYYAITHKFGYRDDDEMYSFQVQCVWALGAINTSESTEKIKLLRKSDIKPIRKAAKHQMKKWNIL